MVNWESRGQGYDEFKRFKLVGVNRVGLWAWSRTLLYRSGIEIIPSGTVVIFVVILGSSRLTSIITIYPRLIQIHPDSPQIQYDCPAVML